MQTFLCFVCVNLHRKPFLYCVPVSNCLFCVRVCYGNEKMKLKFHSCQTIPMESIWNNNLMADFRVGSALLLHFMVSFFFASLRPQFFQAQLFSLGFMSTKSNIFLMHCFVLGHANCEWILQYARKFLSQTFQFFGIFFCAEFSSFNRFPLGLFLV